MMGQMPAILYVLMITTSVQGLACVVISTMPVSSEIEYFGDILFGLGIVSFSFTAYIPIAHHRIKMRNKREWV